jgi:hypothetical protein
MGRSCSCSAPLELPDNQEDVLTQTNSLVATGTHGRNAITALSNDAMESMDAHIREVNAFLGEKESTKLPQDDIATLRSHLKQSNDTNTFQLQLLASLRDTITALTSGSGQCDMDGEAAFELKRRSSMLDAREAYLDTKEKQVQALMKRVHSDEVAMNVS